MTDPVNLPASPSTSSPDSSASDSDDVFNTEDARIHFGPLTSPEKRISSIVARSSSLRSGTRSSLVRRSPRLSTPQSRSPQREAGQDPPSQDSSGATQIVEEEGEAIDDLSSRQGTPDVEQALQDEPPSALAIKISRAHDNPSPPPSPPSNSTHVHVAAPVPRPPHPSLSAALLNSPNASDAEGSTPSTSSNATPGLSRNISPVPTITTRKASQVDLTSFESFSSPAAVFRFISPLVPETRPALTRDNPSVDDLFSQSPTHPRSPKGIEAQVAFPSEVEIVNRPAHERNDEQHVRDCLLTPDAEEDQTSVLPLNTLNETTRTPTGHSNPFRGAPLRPQQTISVPPPGLTLDGSDGLRGSKEADDEEHFELVEDEDMHSTPEPVFLRELGSLSPTSNDLLSSLVAPSSSQQAHFSLAIPTNTVTRSNISTRRPFPSSTSQQAPQTPLRFTSPVRFANPLRPGVRDSSNIRLHPMSMDDPNCTPARRIPIGEAVAQGHISPLKGSQLLASGSRSMFDGAQKPPFIIHPTDSPARRVLTAPEVTTPAAQKKRQGLGFGSPARNASKERFGSIEPLPAGRPKEKAREPDGFVPPPSSGSSSFSWQPSTSISSTRNTSKPTKLPFPLVPSSKDMPATIPEERQDDAHFAISSPTKSSQVSASPTKSSLKKTTSRIPRTVKPYAKPTLKPQVDKGKASARTITSTTEVNVPVPALGGTLQPGRVGGDGKANKSSTAIDVPPTALKRKRTVIEKSSPVKPRSLEMLRQVPRLATLSSLSTSNDMNILPSIPIPKKPQHIRRVIDKFLSLDAGSSTKSTSQTIPAPPPGPSQRKLSVVPHTEALDVDGLDDNNIKEAPRPERAQSSKTPSPDPIADMTVPSDMTISEGVRRTTRVRKVLNPSIPGTSSSSDVKPRRKPNAIGDASYSGLSATALRALTTSNTVRNQRYVTAKLETEVIRKEGDRPETPMIKIKTISQREQDDKGKERKERAARRARLSGEGVGNSSEQDERSDGVSEDESDSDDSSPTPKRHKRGPGDEEDYTTPMRKLRRLNLEDDDDAGVSSEQGRRVKWDRGLFTAIYLDQVKLGTRRPPKENIATKGCLAPAAKILPLDNLGNLPYANSPLTDLVEVNVVVKKFIYDNDEEAVEEVVVKSTKTRSKRGKS
ncbi:hypothetical protein H0H87_000039 [Tephrocybe sp. NHM501043]|nr:hypothetical protein H0H87_000039 [Tephrocybe sp. NHM501043]